MNAANPTVGGFTVERLAETLRSSGEISDQQHNEVLTTQDAVRKRLLKANRTQSHRPGSLTATPTEIIANMRMTASDGRPLDEDRIQQTVAGLAGMPYRKIDPLKLDHKLVTETMTRAFARRHVCAPLSRGDAGVTFAIDNPFDQDLMHQLSALVGGRVRFVVSAKADILRIITEIYGFRRSVEAAEKDIGGGFDIGNLEQLVRLKKVHEIEANDQHIVNAVEYVLHYAYDQRASDIHMEPGREEAKVRLRIDGVLHEIFRVPKVVHRAMVSRLKTLARMDIAERRRPQDGRIKTQVGDSETELRVASMPVAFGEKLVLRIFDPHKLFMGLAELGFEDEQRAVFTEFLTHRHGMILVTGPTGSGKTTTLYSSLSHVATPDINVVTIEDPIEMVNERFNQVLVQRKIDLDFAQALRAVLRQDPDVVMVGEIRDEETAQMAVQAALTGHLVLSTVHTNNAAAAITRMRDLGVPSFLLSSVLIGVVAQRLVRLVCDQCAETSELSAAQATALDIRVPEGASTKLPVRVGKGCPRCRQTGLYGRLGVYEVLPVDRTIRNLIRTDADANEILSAAKADGMVSMRESAIRHLAQGRTAFAEVVRVLGET